MSVYTGFDDILADKVSGSTIIALNSIRYILKLCKKGEDVLPLLKKMQFARPQMVVLVNTSLFCQNAITQGKKPYDVLSHVERELTSSIQNCAIIASRYIRGGAKIATLSYSEQVAAVFELSKEKIGYVFIFAEDVVKEEKYTWKRLHESGVKSSIFDLGSAEYIMPSVDCTMTGSDILSKRWFANKKGTLRLINASKAAQVPVYVVTTKWKTIENNVRLFREKISEGQFERIPNRLIDLFILETGALKSTEL